MNEQEIPEWASERAARRKLKVSAYDIGYGEQVVYFEQLGEEFGVFVTREEALSELSRNQVTDEMMALACQAYETVTEYPYNAEALKGAIQAVVKDRTMTEQDISDYEVNIKRIAEDSKNSRRAVDEMAKRNGWVDANTPPVTDEMR
jgi:hypothetical protein